MYLMPTSGSKIVYCIDTKRDICVYYSKLLIILACEIGHEIIIVIYKLLIIIIGRVAVDIKHCNDCFCVVIYLNVIL